VHTEWKWLYVVTDVMGGVNSGLVHDDITAPRGGGGVLSYVYHIIIIVIETYVVHNIKEDVLKTDYNRCTAKTIR